MKRVFRIILWLRVVISIPFATLPFVLAREGSKPNLAVILISLGAYLILMESLHWWVMRGMPKIQGRMMLAEPGVIKSTKPPNRFWYWFLRDWITEQRTKETSDEES